MLGDLLSDLDEPLAIVSADPLLGREFVHHLDAREFCRQRLSARWRTPVGRNGDDRFRLRIAGRRGLGLVEEPKLIGRALFAATPEAFGDEEVDLFLEGLRLACQSRDFAVFLREEGEDLMSVRREFEDLE